MNVFESCMQLWGSTNYPPLRIDFVRIGERQLPSCSPLHCLCLLYVAIVLIHMGWHAVADEENNVAMVDLIEHCRCEATACFKPTHAGVERGCPSSQLVGRSRLTVYLCMQPLPHAAMDLLRRAHHAAACHPGVCGHARGQEDHLPGTLVCTSLGACQLTSVPSWQWNPPVVTTLL